MGMKLLYIGNHKDTIHKVKEHSELEVELVDNGFTAYKYLNSKESKALDAIVAETNIPGVNGEELVRHLRIKKTSNIPYLLINGTFSQQDKERLLKQGIADGYGADFNPTDLIERIGFLKAYGGLPVSYQHKETEYKMPIVKRLFDILVAGTALLAISPILLLVVIAIRLESKGKVYYISKRVGTGYRVFDFYKLRSMYTGADAKLKDLKHLNQYSTPAAEEEEEECQECKKLGHACSPILLVDGGEICESFYQKKRREKNASAFIKIKDDPRITKVGKFIRNTSIDELPQLINVIKGDMSIVGNRPLPLYEAEQLTSDQWILRFMAPAGITGLWQTKKRGKGSMSDEERKSLDNEYALNYSILNDIKIILLTVPALFQKENV
jgi:lipopolysaccharide/colanic/teichoic acid biosynthesis glycosyltransferase